MQEQEWAGRMAALPWLLLMVGLGLILVSSQMIEQGRPPRWLSNTGLRLTSFLGVKGWQVVALALSPVLAWVAHQTAGEGLDMINPLIALSAWVVAILLILLGSRESRQEQWSLSRQSAITLGLLVAIAFLVRFVNLSRVPPVLTGDEASSGLASVEMLDGSPNNPFRAGWYSFPALFFFIQAVPIALFGQTIQALRLTAVVAGALTVGAVYLAAKQLFSDRAALFAAIFLAVFNFHNHFSRIGLNNIWDGLWVMVVLGLAWHGWQHDNRHAFVLAGLWLGFSQYFYVSVRVLFLLIPLWVFIAGLVDRQRLKRNLPGLVLMGLAALVVFMPLGLYYLRHLDEFMAPMRRVSILGAWMANEVQITGLPAWRILLHQLALGLQGFAHTPLRMWYQPGTPLMRLVPAILFFLGLGLLLRKPRDSRTILLVAWLLVYGLVNGFSESVPAAQRYVAVAPAVAILVGYGMAKSGSLLGHLWPRYKRRLNYAILIVVMLLSFDEVRFYFRDYTPQSDLGGENTLVANRLAEYLQTKSGQWEVAFFGAPRMGYYSIPSLQYLAPHIEGYNLDHPWGSPENPQLPADHLIFVFLPEWRHEIQAVQASYPGGKQLQKKSADGQPLYWLYEFEAGGDQ